MSYWILPTSGIPVSRIAVQCVTYIDKFTDDSKHRFEVYDKAIKEIPHKKETEESFASPKSTKTTMEMSAKLEKGKK